MKFIFIKKNKGFTIIETLVAVAILMISVAGPLTVAQKGLNGAIYAKDQVIANYLAQDAMEEIKNLRDNYMLANDNANIKTWMNDAQSGSAGLSSCRETSRCSIDTSKNIPSIALCTSNCNSSSAFPIYDNGSSLTHDSTNANITKFSRSIYFENIKDDTVTAVVSVSWNNGTIDNLVKLESDLYSIKK